MVDLSDSNATKNWISEQERDVVICFATRNALRALPVVVEASPDLMLPTLRAVAIAAAACRTQTPDLVERAKSCVAHESFSKGRFEGNTTDAYYGGPDAAVSAATCVFETSAGAYQAALNTVRNTARAVTQSAKRAPDLAAEVAAQEDADFLNHASHPLEVFDRGLWSYQTAPDGIEPSLFKLQSFWRGSPEAWEFWNGWYEGFWHGKPLPWDVQQELGELPDFLWDNGPQWIAVKTRAIKRGRNEEPQLKDADDQGVPSVTGHDRNTIVERISQNRDAIALTVASLVVQIEEFRETVRGRIGLDPDYRSELLAFLEQLTLTLERLLQNLPVDDAPVSDETATEISLWWKDLRPLLSVEAKKYISPENMTQAFFPVSIIMLCTGVGAMLGHPTAGGLVGGLITGQVKPGKAVDDLFGPSNAGKSD